MKLLLGQVAQAKKQYCLRIVCVCLRLKYLFVGQNQRGSKIYIFKNANAFEEDSYMFQSRI